MVAALPFTAPPRDVIGRGRPQELLVDRIEFPLLYVPLRVAMELRHLRHERYREELAELAQDSLRVEDEIFIPDDAKLLTWTLRGPPPQ